MATVPLPRLTPREAQILGLLAEGKTAPQIATELHIGLSTVQTWRLHVYAKLDVHNAVAAVVKAARAGLITVDGLAPTGGQQ